VSNGKLDGAYLAYAQSTEATREASAGHLWSEMERWAKEAHRKFWKRPCTDSALDMVAIGWEKLDTYDPARGTFTNWFGAVCLNEMRDRLRESRREVSLDDVNPARVSEEPAWQRYSPGEQKLLGLLAEGKNKREIAEALDIPADEVKRNGLKRCLIEAGVLSEAE